MTAPLRVNGIRTGHKDFIFGTPGAADIYLLIIGEFAGPDNHICPFKG
jgi:hypothetical protein